MEHSVMDMKTQNSTAVSPVGLIIRQKDPNNLEMPFDQLGEFITPSELFYIRSHFPVPELDPAAFRLSIRGAVRSELSLSYADLRAMPSRTCIATLECAGNGRVFLAPPVPGAQWELGAVGNAEWTGVPISVLLESAGLADDVCDIVLEGADRGVPKEEPKPPVPISYARSIPRARAMEPDVLIAYQMNGQDLTPDHGYPLRAIVPGYYGMSSVKWLTNIVAVTRPFQGYWQTSDYAYWDDSNGIPVRRPLSEIKLKSQIARPRVYERLQPGRAYIIFGAAWAGDTDVAEICISLDGGASWVQGDFIDPIGRHAWRRWKYDWITPTRPGRYTLMARATGKDQRPQPEGHHPNFGGYVIDHPLPIEVFVGAL
jgi:DMSO/TMAO reductase YedYZ molybdopterin-dependent catalytic subunit